MSEVIIVVGSGGVGKTSVSSMLGFHHAQLGKKVLVITIDPARRLLDALGLSGHSKDPLKVKADMRGELYAFMPDLKQEWMDFLEASLKEQKKLHDISQNHFYRYMTEGFSGSLEIICSHILFRLIDSKAYDVIVLDTPPSSHSLSFFEVPQKIKSLLERSIFQALMKKRSSIWFKFSKQLAFFSSSILQKTLAKILGSHFLSELIDFALSIDALYEPLYQRAVAMDELLRDDKTSWVLVAHPDSANISDSMRLCLLLKHRGIKIHELIFNRLMPDFALSTSDKEWLLEHKTLATLSAHYDNERIYEEFLMKRLAFQAPKKLKKIYLQEQGLPQAMLSAMLEDYSREQNLMRVLGIDIGIKRTGMAMSDDLGISVSLLRNLEAQSLNVAVEKICCLVHEFAVSAVVIGAPEARTAHSKAVYSRALVLSRALKACLEEQGLKTKVHIFDESYSSKNAMRSLVLSGVSKKKRLEKLDAAAAAYMVEQYLIEQGLGANND